MATVGAVGPPEEKDASEEIEPILKYSYLPLEFSTMTPGKPNELTEKATCMAIGTRYLVCSKYNISRHTLLDRSLVLHVVTLRSLITKGFR